jgi:hypothetical protein
MKRLALYDIDSTIPNLALMKLSSVYRRSGWKVKLYKVRGGKLPPVSEADLRLASSVFYTESSASRIQRLENACQGEVEIGGSGYSLEKRLAPEIENAFPDYRLYGHSLYALGFVTRGCNKRCAFCIVPAKEGRVKERAQSFDDFVPRGQRNVMLLDDNLLSFPGAEEILREMIQRRYTVNFSQTLDIAYLTESKYRLLRQIDYQSARFNNRMIYFSLNYPRTIRQFMDRRDMLRGFGEDCVTVVCIYGFDTSLSADYERFLCLRRLRLIPFFQEYWPIAGVPDRMPTPFFDMDLRAVIRLTFRANGYNWEKYLRWLNLLYFETFGRFYQPLVEIIHRYNNKPRHDWYRDRAELMTKELYRDFRSLPPRGFRGWSVYFDQRLAGRRAPPGMHRIMGMAGCSWGGA